jgi:tetratricopeptide (TPR) repeat protein
MRQLCLGLSIVMIGCASVPVVPPPVLSEADVAAADARLAEGCYDCLIDARDRYARLADGPFRATLLPRLFEAELLIAHREKELNLPASASVARARLLAPELPVTFGADRLLRLVEALPEAAAGAPRREQRTFRQAHQALLGPGLAAELDWLPQSGLREPVRQYVMAALACASRAAGPSRPGMPSAGPEPTLTAIAPIGDPPLLIYGEALCARVRRPEPFEAVRGLVPEFREASVPLSQLFMGVIKDEGPTRALAAAQDAYERFADSPAVTLLYGAIHQLAANCGDALRFYDETLALRPAHEDAGLGRAVCLSVLDRYAEAVAAATVLIDAAADNRIEAFYWRAWNQRRLENLPSARDDIERAKRLGASVDIYTLAGIIAYEQDRLDAALTDLQAARSMSAASCTAAWYLGLVHMRREVWPNGAFAFESAMTCFEISLVEHEAARAVLEANTIMDPAFKARQIAASDVAITEARRQMHAAAMNAAKNFALAGNRARAVQLGERASADPSLASEVEVLHEYLGRFSPSEPAAEAR